MAGSSINHAACVPIAFVGTVLGPFYTHDPKRESRAIGPSFRAIAELDPAQAAEDWPFVKAPVAREALEEMQAGLADEQAVDALAKEYRRLFARPADKASDTARSHSGFGDRAASVAQPRGLDDWLSQQGIAIAPNGTDAPDAGIGTLLELMAGIAQNKPELLETYLCTYLLPGVPRVLEGLEEKATHPFYHGLVLLTLESLQGIQRMFGLAASTREPGR